MSNKQELGYLSAVYCNIYEPKTKAEKDLE
jgi:hypothetical protein